MHARARGPYSNTTFRSLAIAEVAADFSFSHRSSDQDYPEIAPNDTDGLVTSRRYLVYNSWCRKWGDYLDLVPVSSRKVYNPYYLETYYILKFYIQLYYLLVVLNI